LDPVAVRALYELLGGDREALVELADSIVDEAPQTLAEIRGEPSMAMPCWSAAQRTR
jgi:hypothetical protein